ncbi:hypothetical protein PHYBOEH_005344 [Phytophthora boehmeriae]|uniref:BED-type domain-containing protein n=1 Tax=Phytophthora boehmeriae TaxID=109152 RepID=A0A8T1X5E4_9STRA|nr:hypothetical protein PHYBOEH_005344 [Phytophthora boehmeriae]
MVVKSFADARPLLPIWKEFETTVPSDETKRQPDVQCRHCRREIRSARPKQLRGHALKCQLMPMEARMKVGYKPTGDEQDTQSTREEAQDEEYSSDHCSNDEEEETEAATATAMESLPISALAPALIAVAPTAPTTDTAPKPALTPAPAPSDSAQTNSTLGKRPRVEDDTLEGVLKDIRNVMDGLLQVKRQEVLLRREELEFQKEAMASKLEYKRQLREEERRERIEQREAERQERLEMARIENEKSMTFIKAMMEDSTRQRR